MTYLPQNVQASIREKCGRGVYIYDENNNYVAGPPVKSDEARQLVSKQWDHIKKEIKTRLSLKQNGGEAEEEQD